MKEYSIKNITKAITSNIILIIICAVVIGGGFAFIAHHKQSTIYTASRGIMVTHNYNRTRNRSSAVDADQHLIPTYQDILNDNSVAVRARKKLPKNIRKHYSVADINHVVTSTSKGDSLVINVHAKTNSAKDSVAIVNAVTASFKNELPKIDAQAGKVHLLSRAERNNVDSVTKPSIKKYTILGVGLGILFGMVLSILLTTWRKFL